LRSRIAFAQRAYYGSDTLVGAVNFKPLPGRLDFPSDPPSKAFSRADRG
jgi:hypothetical protein